MKFNLFGWIICQFKKHKMVPGHYIYRDLTDPEWKRWVPLHCSRCGMTFEPKK